MSVAELSSSSQIYHSVADNLLAKVGESQCRASVLILPYLAGSNGRGKNFPLLSSSLLLLKLVWKIEIMSLAPSHHFIKIKILSDSPNVIFRIYYLSEYTFVLFLARNILNDFLSLFFSSPQHCYIQSFKIIVNQFPRIQFKLNFHILKGVQKKQLTSKKSKEGSIVTPGYHSYILDSL